MKELFKALDIQKKINNVKKHFVKIQGKEVEVSMEKKIEIIRNGESNYILEGMTPVLVEIKIDMNVFPEIENFTSDPYWPTERFIWKK
jgi:glyoxylate carboligase